MGSRRKIKTIGINNSKKSRTR